MERVDVVINVTWRWLQDRYIDQRLPVVVTNGSTNASGYQFPFENLAKAYEQDGSGWRVCHFSTNWHTRTGRLIELFRLVRGQPYRPWFAHWQGLSGWFTCASRLRKSIMTLVFFSAQGKLRNSQHKDGSAFLQSTALHLTSRRPFA